MEDHQEILSSQAAATCSNTSSSLPSHSLLSASLPHIPNAAASAAMAVGVNSNQQQARNCQKSLSIEEGVDTQAAAGGDHHHQGETWKSLKSAAASAVNNCKDKSNFRKFIKYFGNNTHKS